MTHSHGTVVLRPGSPAETRAWAVSAGWLDISRHDMDYDDLGRRDRHPGEIQIFRHFRRNVSVARRARAEVLARPGAPADPQRLREAVWARGEGIADAERERGTRRATARSS